MTKRDFLSKIPDIINHKSWGYGELEIIVDTKEQKGVCYRYCIKEDNGIYFNIDGTEYCV